MTPRDSRTEAGRLLRRAILIAAAALCGPVGAKAAFLDPMAFSSLGTLTLSSGTYTIDTSGTPLLLDSSNNVLFAGTTVAQSSTFNPTAAVFTFDSISIGQGVKILIGGSRPAALLSRSNVVLSGSVTSDGTAGTDGSFSGPGSGGEGGAGAGRGGNGASNRFVQGTPGIGPGGGPSPISDGLDINANGVGGGFGGIGGHNVNGPTPFGPTYGDLAVALEAGSGGSGSNDPGIFSRGAGGGGGGGAIELGAVGSILVGNTGLLGARGGKGGAEAIIGYMGGGGSGGGLFLHAPTITLQQGAAIDATGGAITGGGGRILFLTDSGTVAGPTSGVTTGPTLYGAQGTITYGTLGSAPIPEPSSIVLLAVGTLGIVGYRRLSGRGRSSAA